MARLVGLLGGSLDLVGRLVSTLLRVTVIGRYD